MIDRLKEIGGRKIYMMTSTYQDTQTGAYTSPALSQTGHLPQSRN